MSKLDDIFSDQFHDGTYNCTRVWEAWSYGTMTRDDFVPANEDEEFLESLKQQIKDLMLELIGENGEELTPPAIATNVYRNLLRQKVHNL